MKTRKAKRTTPFGSINLLTQTPDRNRVSTQNEENRKMWRNITSRTLIWRRSKSNYRRRSWIYYWRRKLKRSWTRQKLQITFNVNSKSLLKKLRIKQRKNNDDHVWKGTMISVVCLYSSVSCFYQMGIKKWLLFLVLFAERPLYTHGNVNETLMLVYLKVER